MATDTQVMVPRPHPRTLGWVGVTALAMGGSNQSLFLIGALLLSQGSAAVPLLIAGLMLSWMAAPGWTELVLMYPNRVGGIAASCAEAFRPYSPVLANLTGVCYWWGWVPTCGLTALLSASALHQWYMPAVNTNVIAVAIVVLFTAVNLAGVRWVSRVARPVAAISATLAFLSAVLPVVGGQVNWRVATSFHLETPFAGLFGGLTSLMAGLYLVGFAAPAFEAATCHVGEMKNPVRDLPRAMLASAGMAGVYFIVLPVVWLGVFGSKTLQGDLTAVLGPTFALVFGAGARSAAIAFMVFNMFHGSLQPLAGASRTLSQLGDDGLVPRFLALRSRTDAPWVATIITAVFAIIFLLAGDPIWVVAAANLTYLLGIALPNVAVWLLRRNSPDTLRPWRAPTWSIQLGVVAAVVWLVSTILGFQQFGLPTVLFGIALAYSGSVLYAWRILADRRGSGLPLRVRSLHLKLTGAMLAVLVLDGAGYLLAVTSLGRSGQEVLVTACEDIFVAVALLTIAVGLILPGAIAHATSQVAAAADHLAVGPLADLTRALERLGVGHLDQPLADPSFEAVVVQTKDELSAMANSFNTMQSEVLRSVQALEGTRQQLQSTRARLEDLAYHDSLTGLGNRADFRQRVNVAAARGRRHEKSFGVMLLDLDNFKTVNDSLGHETGDQLLRAVAVRLVEQLRPEDFAARLGGDEFAVLVEGLTDAGGAIVTAARILASFESPFEFDGRSLAVTASLGISIHGEMEGLDAEGLLRMADVAMYAAKNEGKGRYRLFDQGLHRVAMNRLAMEQELHTALREEQFLIEYQPQVDVASGRLVGAEALVRWNHPEQGRLSPDMFVPLAEEVGLIIQLDRWVMRQACLQAKGWADAGLPALRVAVNVSGRALESEGFVQSVRTILEETRLPPRQLEVELTESVAVRQTEEVIAALEEVRAMGVSVAVDDFGTGYSMLSRLQNFPLDRLKIDRSFVGRITSSEDSVPIVAAMLTMAHGLGMQVIAEGVEDAAQFAFLVRNHCEEVQGYLFGRPTEAAGIAELLSRRQPWKSILASVGFRTLDALAEVVSAEPTLPILIESLLVEVRRSTGMDQAYVVRHAQPGGAEVVWGIQKEGTATRRNVRGRPFFESRAEIPIVLGNGDVWGDVCATSDHPVLLSQEGLESMELVSRLIASRIDQDNGNMRAVSAEQGSAGG
ncbi:MAG: amino acid permease [Candidatus Dormibacteria bacterium]